MDITGSWPTPTKSLGELQKVWNAPKFLTNEHSNFSNVWFLLLHLHPSLKPVCQISRIWAAWGLLFLNLATPCNPNIIQNLSFPMMMRKSMVTRSIPVGKRPCSHLFAAFFFPSNSQRVSFFQALLQFTGLRHPDNVILSQKCEICCSDPKTWVRKCVYNSHEFATTLGRILLFHLFWGIALLFAGLVASG